jgi:methylphosphotriester-DNA--protein-cysteine methyltransferase
VAGIGKFRLVKLFRDRTGLPPHALQIAHRLRRARSLLEAGHTAAEAAARTGFTDTDRYAGVEAVSVGSGDQPEQGSRVAGGVHG